MTLKEKINSDFMTAFKSKNVVAKSILSVVKGEIQTVEKNVGVDNLSDAEVIKILTKTVKSLKETISMSTPLLLLYYIVIQGSSVTFNKGVNLFITYLLP